MSVYDDNVHSVDPRELDLLVDGELSEAPRRALLRRLDQTPGGWRQCALAFLEAQSWRAGLGSLGGELTRDEDAPARIARRRPPSPARRWTTVLAVAAGLLIALGIGLLAGDMLRESRRGGAGGGNIASTDGGSAFAPEGPDDRKATPGRTEVPSDARPGPWRTVRVTVPGRQGESSQTLEVPCLESEQFDGAWLRDQPLRVPPELVRALRDPHVRVRQYRQLVPLRTPDGHQVVLPLERYRVQYVDNPAY